MDITYWHRYAYMYLEKELDIAEIVKILIVNTYVGVIEDDKPNKLLGINVFNNSKLNEALILGMLRAYPDGQPVTYQELAHMLGKHYQTVASAVKRMVKDGILSKRNVSVHGAIYTIKNDSHLSPWMVEFTRALVQIETDPVLREKVYEDCKHISFRKGFQALKDEIVSRMVLPPVVRRKRNREQSKDN